MKTLNDYFKRDSAYWGERGDWLVAYGTNRDADTLTRSNWECFVKLLGGESETVAIERASHWACGWVERLVIHPSDTARIALAEETLAALENYPVINEEHWSKIESDEADQVWRTCYRISERIEYVRAHRSQFEFHGFGDLLGCIRGKYFAGYASELLH